MNTRRFIYLMLGLLAFTLALAGVATHASVTHGAAAGDTSSGNDSMRPTTDVTVRTLNISNEAPGHLIDHLYAQLGDVSFFVALGYLKDHSNGIISEEFYNAVDTAPMNEDAKLTMLRDWRRPFTDSVEIAENAAVHICSLKGNATYSGFTTVLSPDGQFNLTYTQDPARYIHTGSESYPGIKYNYKAFAIAWKQAQRLYLPLIVR
jgi:hypothetical protein